MVGEGCSVDPWMLDLGPLNFSRIRKSDTLAELLVNHKLCCQLCWGSDWNDLSGEILRARHTFHSVRKRIWPRDSSPGERCCLNSICDLKCLSLLLKLLFSSCLMLDWMSIRDSLKCENDKRGDPWFSVCDDLRSNRLAWTFWRHTETTWGLTSHSNHWLKIPQLQATWARLWAVGKAGLV